MNGHWKTALLATAPLLFVPLGVDTREVPRALLVFVFAALSLGTVAWAAWALPWLGACALAWLWTPAPANETLLGVVPVAQGTLLWLAYALIVLSGPHEDLRRAWHRSAAVLVVLQLALAGMQALRGLPTTGSLGHPMFLGAFSALGALVAVGLIVDGERRVGGAALGAALMCIVLAGRRGPLLMCVLGLVAMAFVLRPPWRKLAPSLLAATLLVLALGLVPRAGLGGATTLERWLTLSQDAQASAAGRLSTFSATWTEISARPLSGHGPSRFADIAATWTPRGDRHYELRSHDLLLSIAFSLGLPALLAFVVFATCAAVRACKNARNAAANERGAMAAAAAIGPAYGCHLLVNVDQPGVGLWVCALWATAVAAQRPRLRRRAPVAFALIASGLLPLIGSVATHLGAYRLADATAATGCLARRAQAVAERRRDRRATASDRIASLETCDPRDWLSRYHLALALGDADRLPEAIAEMQSVLAALPGLEEAQMGLAELLARDDQAARALTVLHPEQARPAMREPMERLRARLLQSLSNAPMEVH